MAAAARASGAPFLASMKDPPLGPGWMQLRQMTEARWLGMAFPRFLLRLPYGERSSAIESFPFEEMEEPPRHEDYLWGNAALACVCLAGQGFRASLDGLPVHVYHEEGESKMKPCAELLLTQSQVEAMLEMGLMPLISFRDRDVVRLPRFQSIADPLAPLAFRS
jgi:type VI secretion system protein ImpC